ncbi:MAG: hypothetical protein HY911_07200 [Desulfobacterales bacterium]|nr:hypothetical protein [Desulfobacterales bacterium]
MILYQDNRIAKCLEMLRRSGKKAAIAATQVEKIIEHLHDSRLTPDRLGTLTKHGEQRIKGVMKYDLGSGYRLVTFKHAHCLFLLYVGTHDDCTRWIENNRELTVIQIQARCMALPIRGAKAAVESAELESVIDEEEYDPFTQISERDLRRVFCGLVGETY